MLKSVDIEQTTGSVEDTDSMKANPPNRTQVSQRKLRNPMAVWEMRDFKLFIRRKYEANTLAYSAVTIEIRLECRCLQKYFLI
jgi:hypothetical protein